MSSPTRVSSIVELADTFDLFLFDQFGVLHNGVDVYPGMLREISLLKAAHKRVSVISNSGKRAKTNAERLARFGYDDNLIDKVYTSGEVAWLHLRDLHDGSNHNKTAVYVLGNGDDRSAILGLPLVETNVISDANLILIAGRGSPTRTLEEFRSLFNSPIGRGVPALCTNPDLLSIEQGTKLVVGPGQIGACYEAMGGNCQYIGKPHPEIYAHIQSDTGVPASRILCIGDSIEHDVVGARSTGCASLLVRTGINKDLDDAALVLQMAKYASPDYLM